MFIFFLFLGLAFIFLILEVMTLTFYLLIIAIALIFGAVGAFVFGIFNILLFNSFFTGIIISAIFAFIGIFFLWKKYHKKENNSYSMIVHKGNLVEIVAIITIDHVRVSYSGSFFDAKIIGKPEKEIKIGDIFVIINLIGNVLEITEKKN